jgi:carbon storage regulator CsrA
MLVLIRKRNERILIGEGPDAVEVVYLDKCSGGGVKLGIIAPRNCQVDRKEVREAREVETLRLAAEAKGGEA